MNLMGLTSVELGRKIKEREISVIEAVKAAFDNIEKSEDKLNCFITTDMESALKKAHRIQKLIDTNELNNALAGVPLGVKDNICTKDFPTTCGSKMLKNFQPFYSARVINNIEKAGGIIIGKTNMDEFAMGSTTETSYFGETKNPHNAQYVPGGSSGGSCAAVAAEECSYALGTDTGGSIRQPASYCGVVGIKPTYGTVSRYGLIAYASSLDQIGVIAKDVTDCTVALEMISSYDIKDSTSVKRQNYNFTLALSDNVKGLRIGIPKDYFTKDLSQEVKDAVLSAVNIFKEKGAVIEEFDLKLTEYVIPTYYTIALAEASSNLSRYDGVKYGYRAKEYKGLQSMYEKTRSQGFGTEVKNRIMLGSFVLSEGHYEEYYLKALQVRTLIKKSFDEAFNKYHIILGPVAPTTAPKLGESLKDSIKMYLSDVYTVSANLAGLPAISVPCGRDSKGLPIGMQLTGNYFMEEHIIRAAYSYEQSRIASEKGVEKHW